MKDQQLACNRCAVRTAGIISAEDKKKDRCAQNYFLNCLWSLKTMKFIINQVKLIQFEDRATWWYIHDSEIPWCKRQGLMMILICILPLLTHKIYKQKVNYSTNPRIWREYRIKEMVWSLLASRKTHGLHSSGATRMSMDPLCKRSVYTNSATHPAHRGIYCSKPSHTAPNP